MEVIESILKLVAALALLLILLVVFVVYGFKFWFRRKFGGMAKTMMQTYVALPWRNLLGQHQGVWYHTKEVEQLRAQAEALGFVQVGNFDVEGMCSASLVALVHTELQVAASIYDHEHAGVWFRLVTRYPDKTEASVDNSPLPPFADIPDDFHRRNPQSSLREAWDELLARRKPGPYAPVDAENFVESFEQSYARAMTQAIRRCDVPMDYVRASSKLFAEAGTRTDEEITEFRQRLIDVLKAYVPDACTEEFVRTSRLSAAQWEACRERTLVIHERMAADDVVSAFCAHAPGLEAEGEEVFNARNKCAEPLALFAALNDLVPAKSSFMAMGEMDTPARAVVYLAPRQAFQGTGQGTGQRAGGLLAFAYKATDKEGKAVTDRVTASSTDHAFAKLGQQGYRNIQMLDSEGSAVKLNDELSSTRLIFSTAEEEALRRQQGFAVRTFWSFCRMGNMMIWLPLLAWLVFVIVKDGWPSPVAALPSAALTTFILWFLWKSIPGLLYDQALQASAWYRWAEVERWMRRLAFWKKHFNAVMHEHELIFRTATAEAGQGRLADGLRRAAVLEKDPSLVPGFYQSRLASVYTAAGDYQRAADLQAEARAIKPTVERSIDLASSYARRLGRFQEAAALLDEVDPDKLGTLAQAFYYRCRGIIAEGTGNPAAACEALEKSLSFTRAHAGTPLMQIIVLEVRAYYGLALAATGRKEEAKAHFVAAKPMLIAQKDAALQARCEAALR